MVLFFKIHYSSFCHKEKKQKNKLFTYNNLTWGGVIGNCLHLPEHRHCTKNTINHNLCYFHKYDHLKVKYFKYLEIHLRLLFFIVM